MVLHIALLMWAHFPQYCSYSAMISTLHHSRYLFGKLIFGKPFRTVGYLHRQDLHRKMQDDAQIITLPGATAHNINEEISSAIQGLTMKNIIEAYYRTAPPSPSPKIPIINNLMIMRGSWLTTLVLLASAPAARTASQTGDPRARPRAPPNESPSLLPTRHSKPATKLSCSYPQATMKYIG